MSRKTIARRYNTKDYTDTERTELTFHLVQRTQPQRRIFLGKTEGFKNDDERKFYTKMLKAYLRGDQYFYFGKVQKEIIGTRYNKETKTREPFPTGVMEMVPAPHLVKQMYFFN